MSSTTTELTLLLKAKNLASREVDKLHGSLNKAAKGAAGLGGAFKKLVAVGIAGFLVAGAAVVATLFGATKAAADEQKGIAQLNAALKANDKHFKGNTDAIEKVISKREALAFSDDDLRLSLATLVVKFKDTNKALKLQTTAMDLARLKGISLNDASLMLAKGLDGNAKVLKVLGISLPKTATEQQRLTAIQHAAAGQADAYGKTAAGAQESFKIATQDLVEDLGANLLPVMQTVFTWLRTDALPAIRNVAGAIGHWFAENKPLITQIAGFVGGALRILIGKLGDVVTWIASIVAAIANNKDAMNVLKTIAKGIADAFALIWDAMSKVIGFIGDLVAKITSNKTVMNVFRGVWDGIGTAIKIVSDAVSFLLGKLGDLFNLINANGDTLATIGRLSSGGLLGGIIPGHAEGGWVGLNGPELSVVGEKGPEWISPNRSSGGGGGSASGVTIVGISEREIINMIDRGLFFKLQRAAPTLGRV